MKETRHTGRMGHTGWAGLLARPLSAGACRLLSGKPLSFVFRPFMSHVSCLSSSPVPRLASRALPLSAALFFLGFSLALAAPSFAVPVAPLTTPWGEKVTSENVWRDYPRPQLVRDGWTCLNGELEIAREFDYEEYKRRN